MREWAIGILTTIVFAASATPARAQCDYFVRAGLAAPGGTPDGRTPETAFSTIAAGARAATVPGDVVCVGPGTYPEGNIMLAASGADAMNQIVIRADATGQSTGDPAGPVRVVAPDGAANDVVGFLVRGRQFVVIDGFEIDGFPNAGIQVRADANRFGSSHVTLRNNRLTNCRTGIDLIARNTVAVENNVAVGNKQTGISIISCLFDTPDGRCREIDGGPTTPRVSNNRSGGNGAHGLLVHGADDALIQNNVIYANGGDAIQLRDCRDARVINNLAYANRDDGVSVGRADPALRTVVVNNTFYGNGEWGIEIGDPVGASPGAAVFNNIVWQNRDGIGVLREDLRPASTCAYAAGFNLVLDSYGPETPHNVFDSAADPLFVDPAGPDGVLGGERVGGVFVDRSADDDFHLRQGGSERSSPAVDGGAPPATELGLTGSTASDDRPDAGPVDIGFHYGAGAEQTVMFTPPAMELYVRSGGSDGASGRSPFQAFRTIARAAQEAEAGVSVVVGPGRYPECNLRPASARQRNRGLATFLADPAGDRTGDAPGMVLVDVGQCESSGSVAQGETGFDISEACGVVIDGFHISGAREDGIRVDDRCDGAVLRNNVVFDSGRRAIRVVDSLDVRIVNNLAHGNQAGIHVGGGACPSEQPCDNGSRRAVVEFNTAWDNDFNGIQIGDGLGVSSHAKVRYNVTGMNGKNGIEVGDDQRRQTNLIGFKSYRNLVGDSYGIGVRGADDLLVNLGTSPLYMDPSTVPSEGNWLAHTGFRLLQIAAGQTSQSRAVDYADITALVAELADRTTRTDAEPDAGQADLGYHYPRRAPLVGDCDGDGAVRINELVMAVNIALGDTPMDACLAVDADGNGVAGINEVVGAVANALRG